MVDKTQRSRRKGSPRKGSRQNRLTLTAIIGLLGLTLVGAVALVRGTTQAAWTSKAEMTVPSPGTDRFTFTAIDSTLPMARLNNTLSLTTTNQSTRHSSWIDVNSTTVSPVIADRTNLMGNMAFDFHVPPVGANCNTIGPTYWNVSGVGMATGTYTRSGTRIADATLTPGQSRVVCPLVRPNYNTAVPAGEANFLRNHAARALKVTTVVTQRSEAPATWAAQARTVDSVYRVAIPPPVARSSASVCQGGTYGEVRWAWPFDNSDGAQNAPTPALARAVLLRQNPDGSWSEHLGADPNNRSITGINSDLINNDDGNWGAGATRNFRLRLYPYPGDTSRYVDSTWVIGMRENWDSVQCVSQTTVASTPVNMP